MFPKPSARDRIRTDDTRFRRAVLYPLSYSGNDVSLYTATRPVASCSRGSLRKPSGNLSKPREEPDIRSWPGLSCQFGANCSARRKDTERQRTRYSGKSHEKQGNSKQAGGKGSMAKARSTTTGAKRTSSRRCQATLCQSHGTPSIQVCREATQTASPAWFSRHDVRASCPCRHCRPRAACRFAGTAICADCGIGNALVHVAWPDCPTVGHRRGVSCRTNRHRRNRMQWLLAISVLLLDRPTPPSRAERRGAASPTPAMPTRAS